MSRQTLLGVEKLCVRLGGRLVLNGIDWRIGFGEQWAVLGPNGAGKTTLAKAVAGRLAACGGTVRFCPPGADGSAQTSEKGAIGYVSEELHRHVFERDAFFDEVRHFTGNVRNSYTILDFVSGRQENDAGGFPQSQVRELKALSKRFGMMSQLDKGIASLTTGEISRVIILRALMRHPQLLILDEPFKGIDRKHREIIYDMVSELINDGMHIVLITHRLEDIISEISHILVMDDFNIRFMGPISEFMKSDLMKEMFFVEPEKPKDKSRSVSNFELPYRRDRCLWNDMTGVFNGTKLVEMSDVNVSYDGHVVLKKLNWSVHAGECWLVHGADGAGKTSLLKLITGDNLQVYANKVFLFGKRRGCGETVWEIKRRIGWVSPEIHSKYPVGATGVQVVCSGFFDSIGLYRRATMPQQRQAARVLGALGIRNLGDQVFGCLSHGQKQMLLVARAIVKSPCLLLLDEPCEGLDFTNRRRVLEMIDFIGRSTPTTVVYATSDERDVLSCMTHRLHLERGEAGVDRIGSAGLQPPRDQPGLVKSELDPDPGA